MAVHRGGRNSLGECLHCSGWGPYLFEGVRSSFVRRDLSIDVNFSAREIFWAKNSGRRDRFRPKNVKLGAILAIFEPFEN